MRAGYLAVALSALFMVGCNGELLTAQAQVGEKAPDFGVVDTKGTPRTLSEFRGKLVVLEWFNHDCPFVRKHYNSGNMQRLQMAYTQKKVVWLSINSSAPGRQGHVLADKADALMEEKGAAPTAVLLDPGGAIGRIYGAKTTPHMFIINPEGILVYAGAIDDTHSTDAADVETATNYVAQALDEALAGKPISIPETKSYGCSVKY